MKIRIQINRDRDDIATLVNTLWAMNLELRCGLTGGILENGSYRKKGDGQLVGLDFILSSCISSRKRMRFSSV